MTAPGTTARSRLRLVAWALASVVVLGVGGLLAYRHIRAIGTVPGTDNHPRAFAVHGDRGYVLADPDEGQHALWSVELSGGAPRLLHSGHGASVAIAADEHWVVWSLCDGVNAIPCERGRTMAVRVTGGPARLLVDGGAAETIALGKDRAYMLIKGNQLALELGEDKPAVICCKFALNPVSDVAADDTHVYWLDARTLTRARHRELASDTLATGLMNAQRMALGPNGMYVVCNGPDPDDDEIRHVPFDGSPVTVVAKGLRGIDRPVRWGDWLAFVHDVPVEPGSNTAVMTLSVVPLSGGDLRTLGTRFTGRLVGDGTRLYSMHWDRVRQLDPP
jgi:hypothetical protein